MVKNQSRVYPQFRCGILDDSVIKKYLITAGDGKNYQANHYNLQMIIAVGFKVNNERAVQFRKWAGQKNGTVQSVAVPK
ncbi:MAG: virulence RhuM family protein [Fibrobacter sp.]|nr:virulence RhuM family protein [Fibrobacter sp.]